MKNKNRKFIFILKLCFLTELFVFSEITLASGSSITINEIMYDPAGTDTGQSDWIELYNPTGGEIVVKKEVFGLIDEEKLELGKDGIHYLNCHKIKKDLVIGPKEFVILADNDQEFLGSYSDFSGEVIDTVLNILTNGDTVRLSADKCATFFEEVRYENSWGGKNNNRTLERIKASEDGNRSNWQESYEDGGTPGKENSKKKVYSKEVNLNEIFPYPPSDSEEEYIELYYFGNDKEIDLKGWKIKDKGVNTCDLTGKSITSGGYLIVKESLISGKCSLALNNIGKESVFLFNPNGDEVSSVSYSGAKKNLSYNFDGASWRWSRFLTPGSANKFNQLPDSKSKNDKKIYVGVYAEFSAKAKDKDKDKLKYTWDFGDGHKSYKKETKHKYEKAGKYKVTLKIFDGSEEKIETFKIEVKKFPRDKVKIRSICPNPTGNDSKNEWISVKNYSDDEINLKGWSIATGSKKLYNHWIKNDFNVSPGEERMITRSYASFALNNEKGKVELRYPDGKTAHKVKYKKDDGKAEENEVYKKTESGWQWIKSPKNIKTEEQENVETETQKNEVIEEEDFEEFMNGQSEDLSGKEKQNELFNYGANVKLASYIQDNQGRVLGAETVRSEENIYTFTSPILEEEHYAVKFFKNLGTEINFFINKAILSISSW